MNQKEKNLRRCELHPKQLLLSLASLLSHLFCFADSETGLNGLKREGFSGACFVVWIVASNYVTRDRPRVDD